MKKSYTSAIAYILHNFSPKQDSTMPIKNQYTIFTASIGKIILTANNGILTGCYFENQKYFPDLHDLVFEPELPIFTEVIAQINGYLAEKLTIFQIHYNITNGTPFQRKVWQALTTIQHGKTISYKALADMINAPKSIRAVARAVGRNPISIIIPCHRVIGSNGSLTGYAGGIEKKKLLLNLEK